MTFETVRTVLVWALFAGIAIFMIRGVVRFGFKGSMFGARIIRTVGEVRGARQTIGSLVVRVHVLDGHSPERAVGVELVGKTPLSYHMLPISLSKGETLHLASVLQQAANEAAQRCHVPLTSPGSGLAQFRP